MADETAHAYEPVHGHGLKHDPFNAIVGPRPIGWISTVSQAGVANLAPYSFFNGFNYKPPIIGFSSIGWKDSVANAQATGEFCWNLATRALAREMNLTCAPAPPEVDEFEVAGLTKAPSLRSSSCRAPTERRWRPGWCWARWWRSISTGR
jgi:flavin reductase (DIM6/NTAB) family NADH-FMN oxidoreductase RutF